MQQIFRPQTPRPAEHPRLVAGPDLAQLDPRLEPLDQVLHQLAEIDAVVGGEEEDELAAVEEALHAERFMGRPRSGMRPKQNSRASRSSFWFCSSTRRSSSVHFRTMFRISVGSRCMGTALLSVATIPTLGPFSVLTMTVSFFFNVSSEVWKLSTRPSFSARTPTICLTSISPSRPQRPARPRRESSTKLALLANNVKTIVSKVNGLFTLRSMAAAALSIARTPGGSPPRR